MINIQKIRSIKNPKVIVIGNHEGIIQSILDYDFLLGKTEPSVIAVTGVQQRFLRYYFGEDEVLVPGFVAIDNLKKDVAESADFFAIAQSGRRVFSEGERALQVLKNAQGGMIFAEAVPEQHALALRKLAEELGKFLVGPASVGMTVGGSFKLGAIGGTLAEQIAQSGTLTEGSVAVVSTSGGMINELISMVSRAGHSISFAAAIGGERFPITKAAELINEALNDPNTDKILYFGELGGTDEYSIVELLGKQVTKKPIVAYIAGTVAEKFESAPQFGHAKAMAKSESETASAKKEALRNAGVMVANTFGELEVMVEEMTPSDTPDESHAIVERLGKLQSRTSKSLFVNRVSSDKGGEVKILGEPLVQYVSERSLSEVALSMFLGKKEYSKKLADFFDTSLKVLVDHGPQVSGAINTMITARAGKDLPSSLSAGLLTIGSRFGGAINEAAENWLTALESGSTADEFVEQFAVSKKYIPGIGHKKYRIDNPDPRVALLTQKFDGGACLDFAKEIAVITTGKKGQLILNVDGAIAAILIDILIEEEKMSIDEVRALIATEFCNAIFIYARTVGFIADFMEQKRLDEGLFRLPDDLIIN